MSPNKLTSSVVIAAFLASFPFVAHAAPPLNIPSSADAARAGQAVSAPLVGQPNLQQGSMATPSYKPLPVTADAEKVKFVLNQLVISGSTIYGNEALEREFAGYVGKNISLADLQRITNAITLQYRKDGYILSKAIIPAQKIDGGVVQVQVIEGYIADVQIQGNAKGAKPLLEAYGKQIEGSYPLNIKTLERYALLANDIPGMNVKTVLQPLPPSVAATRGGVALVFIPAQSTANGYVSVDNRGTKYLGPNELSAGGAVNSIFRPGDQSGFQGVITQTTNELQFLNVYTKQPLGSNGITLNLSGSVSHTEPGYTLEPLGIKGNSQEGIATVNVPVIRARRQNLFLTGTFDYLDNDSSLTELGGQPIQDIELYDDHIRSLRLGANYYLNDRFAGANQFGIQLSQGLNAFGASEDNQPTPPLSRALANPQYTKFNFNISRDQGITQSISLFGGAIAQYSFNPLLSAEQFSYGGSQYGQAFDPSEITGDRGVAAKLEARYTTNPDLRFLNNIQYFAGYDFGKVWNLESQSVTGLPDQQTGASTYLGFRTNFNQYVSGSLELAQPLVREVATEQDQNPRIFFSITLNGATPAGNLTTGSGQFVNQAPTGYADGAATNGPTAQLAENTGN